VKKLLLLWCLYGCSLFAQKLHYGGSFGVIGNSYTFPYKSLQSDSETLTISGKGISLGGHLRADLAPKWVAQSGVDLVSLSLGNVKCLLVRLPIYGVYQWHEHWKVLAGPSINYLSYPYAPESIKLQADAGLSYAWDAYFDITAKYTVSTGGQSGLSGLMVSLDFTY